MQNADCTFCGRLPITTAMSFFERSLVGKQIHSAYVDSEITYIMLSDGTQVTIRGWVAIAPGPVIETSESVRER
jgi:hypothetical protein